MKPPIAQRRGSMLVELMVVMPIFATLLVLTIGWIHQSMDLASTMRQRQRHHRQLLTLASQFRDDVHQAQSVRADGETTLVIDRGDALEVTYELAGRQIKRRWRRTADHDQDQAAEAGTSGGNSYALADGSRAWWDRSELPRWIALVVERPRGRLGGAKTMSESSPSRDEAGPADLHVRSAVGRLRPLNVTALSRRPSLPSAAPNSASAAEDVTSSGAASDSGARDASEAPAGTEPPVETDR